MIHSAESIQAEECEIVQQTILNHAEASYRLYNAGSRWLEILKA